MKDAGKGGANEVRVIEQGPLPAIGPTGLSRADASALRATRLLLWFMRTIAVVWIAKGLFAWTVVLGVNPQAPDLIDLPPVMRGLVSFFAVCDLLAAVGLWLAAPWGGVIWLICAGAELMAPALGRQASMTGIIGLGVDAALIAVYFVLNWLAANERA